MLVGDGENEILHPAPKRLLSIRPSGELWRELSRHSLDVRIRVGEFLSRSFRLKLRHFLDLLPR